MRAISCHQPWASLLVTRQPCETCDKFDHLAPVTPHPMVKRFETRSWPCPPALIGQPIAIHATKKIDQQWMWDNDALLHEIGMCFTDDVTLPLGAIVGSGRITASLPIVDEWIEGSYISVSPDRTVATAHHRTGPHERRAEDISDQLPYGDFTPGRYAWQIEDSAPCTERCPWCWKQWDKLGHDCNVCNDIGRCDPIPARGHQRIWNWQP